MKKIVCYFILLASTFLIMACKPTSEAASKPTEEAATKTTEEFFGTDISAASFASTLNLIDHTGKARTLADFKDKVIVLFFGYTHCPDVCPTTMSDLKNVMKLLGEQSDQVQVLFVTVDPERDTQEILAQFVPSFDKRFIGLRGDEAQTKETLKNFKIFYSKVEGEKAGDYTVDHSAGMYVFDKSGKIRVYMGYGQKIPEMVSDIKKLL